MTGTAPTQADAVKQYKVGGRAFPNDFNWVCPAGHHNRKFELTCYSCEVDSLLRKGL